MEESVTTGGRQVVDLQGVAKLARQAIFRMELER